MSAPNFRTMADFPLFVTETPYCKVCPECGCTCADDADECDECGTDIKDIKAVYDEVADNDNCTNMVRATERLNRGLMFHKVTVESGYYVGLQFFVETRIDPNELDNDACLYEWDICRSEACRRYGVEKRRLAKALRKEAEGLGLTELACMGIFSNGEAVYVRVNAGKREKLIAAANAA